MSDHKHEFAFGELTAEEIAKGGVSVVMCETCPFRSVRTNNLTEADREWARGVAQKLFKNTHKPLALVDMDGTLVDYTHALHRDLKKLLAPGEELSDDESVPHIKARIDQIKRQPNWWFNLPQLEAGHFLLKALRQQGYRLHILTRGPKNLPEAWEQKFRWCRTFVPDADVTLTLEKGLVYGRVLVDDWIPYIESWLEYRPRGTVIMPDQPWNRGFTHPQVVRYQLALNEDEVLAALAAQRER